MDSYTVQLKLNLIVLEQRGHQNRVDAQLLTWGFHIIKVRYYPKQIALGKDGKLK